MNINQTLVTNLSNRDILESWSEKEISGMSSNFECGVAKKQFPGKKPTSLEQKATLRLNKFDGLEIPANQLRLVVTF